MNCDAISEKVLESNAKMMHANKWLERYVILEKSAYECSVTLHIFKTAKLCRKSRVQEVFVISEGFFGLESGFPLDNERHTLAIICQNAVPVLSFRNQETLVDWEWTIRKEFGHSYHHSLFALEMPSSLSASANTYVRLHLRNGRFCLVAGTPPRLLTDFRFSEIRRFGAFENKFCIEVGSKSGSWSGMYAFRTGHCDRMASAFRYASCDRLDEYLVAKENSSSNVAVDKLIDIDSSTESSARVAAIIMQPCLHYAKLASALDTQTEAVQPLTPMPTMQRPLSMVNGDSQQEGLVEYARIDCIATQAARKITKSRKHQLPLLDRKASMQSITDKHNGHRTGFSRRSLDVFSFFRFHVPGYTRF